MYVRTKANQETHDQGVANIARQVIAQGWTNVYSDLPGNVKPPVINGHIPDVYAFTDSEEIIVEIETTDSKDVPHSVNQRRAFETWKLGATYRKFVLHVV